MKIYVACLAAYNNGILHGDWIDCFGKSGDDLKEEARKIINSSPIIGADEWAIHDHEGFGAFGLKNMPVLTSLPQSWKLLTKASMALTSLQA